MAETKTLAAFEPTTLTEAMDLSKTISSASLIPAALRGKPADVLISIMAGRELGLSPMQSLRSMHVVQGRPVMSADLMVALCVKATDVCSYFQLVESTQEIATYETHRKGQKTPTKMYFTLEQAKRAGLTGKDNWRSYPEAMLRARCAAALARAVYPDLLAGVYESSELREATQPLGVVPPPEVDVTPPPEPPPAKTEEPATPHPLADRIAAAADQATLDALVPDLLKLPEGERAPLRKAFGERQAALTAQAAVAQVAA